MKNNRINSPLILNLLNPAINLASLKARLRLNEFKRDLTKSKYNNFFRKNNKIYSVSCSMSNNCSMKDLQNYEKLTSDKLVNNFKELNKDLNIFQKKLKNNYKKYKIKPLNDTNKNSLIESISEDISKYLNNLHNETNNIIKNNKTIEDNQKNAISLKKNNLSSIYIEPSIKRNLSNQNLIPLNNSSTNFAKKNLDKTKIKIKKFISVKESNEKIKYRLSKFIQKNENKEDKSENENSIINSHKKLPLVHQNSFIFFSKPEGVIQKYFNKNNIRRDVISYSFKLPNIIN